MSLVFLSACRVMSLEDFKWESNMINLGLIKVNLIYLWKRWWQGWKNGVGSKWGGGGVTWKALSAFNTLDCTLVNMPFLFQICHASYLLSNRSYSQHHILSWFIQFSEASDEHSYDDTGKNTFFYWLACDDTAMKGFWYTMWLGIPRDKELIYLGVNLKLI